MSGDESLPRHLSCTLVAHCGGLAAIPPLWERQSCGWVVCQNPAHLLEDCPPIVSTCGPTCGREIPVRTPGTR